MVLIETWLPPSRENWETIVYLWQFFPLYTVAQWLTDFYPQGKTSIRSPLNLPGHIAWMLMELPGVLIVLYCMFNLRQAPYYTPSSSDSTGFPYDAATTSLPWGNWTMATLYTVHYFYRAILSPLLLNPSMAPIHPLIFLSAFAWQVINGLSLGGWLAGYGPTDAGYWSSTTARTLAVQIGITIWGWGFLGNVYHDDDLREIRRSAMRKQEALARERKAKEETEPKAKRDGKSGKSDGDTLTDARKIYMLPKNGLFHYILYAHYFCEWVEWAGFWLVGGTACVPARIFLVNEISTMLPRALAGKRWYIEKFGKERVGNKKAIIPGIL